MSETFFPINDLLRRKFQTGIVIISGGLCVASTLFLLLFAGRIGFGTPLATQGRLTLGLSTVFSQFMIFIEILVVTVGAIIMSFMVFVMMSQRVRDIGLMKATGCPNNLVFGYFMTELLIVAFVTCLAGVILGIAIDLAVFSFLSGAGLQISQASANLWVVLLVFILFFALTLVFGGKPILDTSKVQPAQAISPTYHLGLGKEPGHKILSKSRLTLKIALRSLHRRKSATLRIVLCLGAVFLLTTVAVAGGIIAEGTTRSWVEKAMGKDVILIAHRDMAAQFESLLLKFSENGGSASFSYSDTDYTIPEDLIDQLRSALGNQSVDARLVLEAHVVEVPGYVFAETTGETRSVGDHHEGDSLVVGVDAWTVLTGWYVRGSFLPGNQASEAVVGDSLARKMFTDPVSQSIHALNRTFDITGICFDPVNNGYVTYVPLRALQNVTNLQPNILMVRVSSSINSTDKLNEVRNMVNSANADFEVVELNSILDRNLGFLSNIWSVIMFLPLLSLVAVSLCLMGYVTLSLNEQRQEFGVLRALGAKPRTVLKIVSWQSLVVLLSSYVVGVAFGIIVTMLILVPDPLVTNFTVLEIAGWLMASLAATFLLSLSPTFRFGEKPIREIMS